MMGWRGRGEALLDGHQSVGYAHRRVPLPGIGSGPARTARRLGLAVLCAALWLIAAPRSTSTPAVLASAADYCSGEQLAVGANWSVCWEVRANEGLVVSHAYFTKPGIDRRVLGEASVAQIFVPYETGIPRYHDVAYGLGAGMVALSPTLDCPGGVLLGGGRVCRQIEDRGVAQKFCAGACTTRRGQALRLWSSSQMGAYNYITSWSFHDDGTVEPGMDFTGALQFGGTAHLHSVYWRLDVDVDDPSGDSVEEFWRINPVWSDGSVGAMGWNPILGETHRPNQLDQFRKWRVVDRNRSNRQGSIASYELVPHQGDGNLRTTVAEGFTRGEFWVTAYQPGERFVSTEESDLLSSYLTGDPVAETDIVLWYAIHEHHEVRDEDAPYMPLESVHFRLRPRGFFDQNPMD